MKKIYSRFIVSVLCTISLFSIDNVSAMKPVAESIQRLYDMNIHFDDYHLFNNAKGADDKKMLSEISSGTVADLHQQNLLSLFNSKSNAVRIDIPFEGGAISVDLTSVNIFTDAFSVVTSNHEAFAYTPGTYYRGIITNNPNSLVSFSFFNNELYGLISDDIHGNIIISKIRGAGNQFKYVVYAEHNLVNPKGISCNTDESLLQPQQISNLTAQARTSLTTNCVRLYYEIDNNLYQNNGSNSVTTTNWMTSVHNNVQTIFANDNISVSLNQIFIWTTADPYTTGTSSFDQLDAFETTRTSFSGDLGMLVGIDGNFGGVAETINGLCSSAKYSYSDVYFSYSTVPTYSWTINVISHEYGHLLGSPHTHNCNWPGGAIDNCGPDAGYPTEGGCTPGPTPVNGGTIMSYCHLVASGINFNNGFGQYPKAAIQTAVDNATCLGTSCTACSAPAHNECSSPAPLTISSACSLTLGSLCGATQSMAPVSCNGGTAAHAYDVWYSITPVQSDVNISCQSGTATDVVLGLYSGTCGNLTLLSCANFNSTGGTETITTSLTPGATYYIRVYDFNGNTTTGDFAICVSKSCTVSPNNICINTNTLPIGSSCSYTQGDLCSATQSIVPASCSGFTAPNAYDLWYTITPAQSNIILTAVSGGNNDIVLGLYSGNCSSLTLMSCVDNTGIAGTETITAAVTSGNTYYVRVYDYDSNSNGTDFQLCAQYNCTAPTAATGASATNPLMCLGAGTTLNVAGTLSSGASWHWYAGSCGANAAGTGSSVNVSPQTTTTYYVRAENGSCFSTCKTVVVTVTPLPSAATSTTTSSPVCAGTSGNISAVGTLSAGATWHWYTGSCGGAAAGTGSPLQVSPVTTTTYYVRAENGNCFSPCTTATLTVKAIPSAPVSISALPSSVCSGSPSTLSVTGTLSSGASWKWYTTSCGVTTAGNSQSITVNPSTNTTYYVRAENGSCFSACTNSTLTVTANPSNPNSIAIITDSICSGDQATLMAVGTLSAGATYAWYEGSCGTISAGTGSQIVVSPSVTTTYFLREENGTCSSNCVDNNLLVFPSPAAPASITPDATTICAGETTILTANGNLSPGSDYIWGTGSCTGIQAGTGSSLAVFPSVTTTYYVYSENGNCRSTCADFTLTVNNPPVSPSIIIAHDTLSVSVQNSYQWYYSNDNITFAASGSNQQQTATGTGYYYVMITDANGCTALSDTIFYAHPDVVIELTRESSLHFYPNPVHDNLTIVSNDKRLDVELNIYDSTGKLIHKSRIKEQYNYFHGRIRWRNV